MSLDARKLQAGALHLQSRGGLIDEQVYAAWTVIMLANVSCGCKGAMLFIACKRRRCLMMSSRHAFAPAEKRS